MDRQANDRHEQSEHRRRGVPAVLAIVLVAMLFVGGTFAYFTRQSTAAAELDLGVNNTEVEIINSWNDKNGGGASGAGLLPGERVNDTVTVRNVGSGACYLRIRARVIKGAVATDEDGRVNPTQLSSALAPDIDDLNAIVGTLYFDPDFNISAGSTLGVGLQPTPFTPVFGNFDNANVLSDNAAQYTRSFLTSETSKYGYVANSEAAYGTKREYVKDGEVASEATEAEDVRRAIGAYDTRLGKTSTTSTFRNVTTRNEYTHGLLTFEYVGASGDGRLPLAAVANPPLITTICVPYDYSTTPKGGTDATTGEQVGYTISFWAESVPADDFEDASEDGEARRLRAMDRLDSIYPASDYFYQSAS